MEDNGHVFFFGGGGGRVNKLHFGRDENGE